MGIGPEETILQRGHKMDNRHMERCSMSLISRELQIKTTVRYHLTPVRMTIINKSTNNGWPGCKEKRTLVHCWWKCGLVQLLCKTVWSFLKKKKKKPNMPYDPVIPFLGIYLKKLETLIQNNICTPMFIVALFTIAKIWKHPKCLSVVSGKNSCGLFTQWNTTWP